MSSRAVVSRVWVQIRKKKPSGYEWENTIAAPLADAREHVERLGHIVGADSVRIAHNRKDP